MTCSSWPETTEWGCPNCGWRCKWLLLDISMDISQTAECELLCHQQTSFGCCYLDDRVGCQWRFYAEASNTSDGLGLAVACVVSGILLLN